LIGNLKFSEMAQKAPPEYSEGNSGPTWRLDGADKLHSRFALPYNSVLRIRILRIHMFLGIPDPNLDPSIIKQKK
jgi:hypothetical protein